MTGASVKPDSEFETTEEAPLEPTSAPVVAGSAVMFQSLAGTFRRGDDTQRHLASKLLLRAGGLVAGGSVSDMACPPSMGGAR